LTEMITETCLYGTGGTGDTNEFEKPQVSTPEGSKQGMLALGVRLEDKPPRPGTSCRPSQQSGKGIPEPTWGLFWGEGWSSRHCHDVIGRGGTGRQSAHCSRDNQQGGEGPLQGKMGQKVRKLTSAPSVRFRSKGVISDVHVGGQGEVKTGKRANGTRQVNALLLPATLTFHTTSLAGLECLWKGGGAKGTWDGSSARERGKGTIRHAA